MARQRVHPQDGGLIRAALAARIGDRTLAEIDAGTIVVVPSITTSDAELRRTPAAEHLEERLLFTLLLLRSPEVRIVYLTALPVAPAIVDYYLRFVPDPAAARERLHLIALDMPGPRALTAKLLARPDAIERVRALAAPAVEAHLLCYKVTPAEHALAAALGMPLDGPAVGQLGVGTKSGSRRAARRAGVAIPDGEEDLWSGAEVEAALGRLHDRRPSARSALVKLNDGFAGRGNVLVGLDQRLSPLAATSATFAGEGEGWPQYLEGIAAEGAVVEEFVERPGLVSSCAQMRIAPSGAVQVVSIYDIELAGGHGQQYAGCRYPAGASHRQVLHDRAVRMARQLAREGVSGWFGLDFIVDPAAPERTCQLNEVNLRMGGGTHPYWMAVLASGGVHDPLTGELRAGGRPLAYVATDDVCSPRLLGRTAAEVVARVDRAGLAFDAGRASGVTLQFLGAVPSWGMTGMTCIAGTPQEAEELRREAVAAVTGR